MYDCGVPREECSGFVVKAQAKVRDGYKAHGDAESARKCAKRFAVKMTAAGDGVVHLPNKPTHLRRGKPGTGRSMAPKIR
jgi:hypothetical protein